MPDVIEPTIDIGFSSPKTVNWLPKSNKMPLSVLMVDNSFINTEEFQRFIPFSTEPTDNLCITPEDSALTKTPYSASDPPLIETPNSPISK